MILVSVMQRLPRYLRPSTDSLLPNHVAQRWYAAYPNLYHKSETPSRPSRHMNPKFEEVLFLAKISHPKNDVRGRP